MIKNMLTTYLKDVTSVANRGDAREESFYSVLEGLLNDYAKSCGKESMCITTLPKKTEAGNPDFRIWDGEQHIIGYIEAKAPTVENLDTIEHSEQLKRYRQTFPNLILTNFFEFRLYRNGDLIDSVQIGRPFIVHEVKTAPPVENEEKFLSLVERFFSFSLPHVYNAESLAAELAKRTRFLRDEVIAEELKNENQQGQRFITGFYEAFQKFLIHGLTKKDFADIYSQTITYGLFAARTRAKNGFNRKLAYDNIPRTIGVLRDIFQFVSLGNLPKQMEWIVDDISEVLAITDVSKLLDEYFHEHKGSDPIVHFYETFLSEYDPKTREKRGVYYTPEPVVSYIVRSLHHILKKNFNKNDGFADTSVTVLDPAAGTLTFLAEAAKLAVDEFTTKYGEGAKEIFIKERILENFYALELMMAPYAVGHLKMSFLLEELGYTLRDDERFKLYLTNTLEMEELEKTFLPGMISLSRESGLANKVKREQPILVILGNPPYSGHSSNIGDWTTKEIRAYYHVDGKPLGEKNPKWLQDDYVKFIRFAQWKIDEAGEGVLGFITNHSYLDNPTFRGMRQSLMQSFNEIYFLDLHGSSRKKEECPDLPASRPDLFWVYVLKCNDESFYIGQTDNVQQRMQEHQKGEVSWTQSRLPIEIILLEEFDSRENALKREHDLKTGFGRQWLKMEHSKGRLTARQAGGSKDENVFDIQQGVAIGIFIKKRKGIGHKVYRFDLWGAREKKYDWLMKNDIETTKWKKLSPQPEHYLFIPIDEKLATAYYEYIKMDEIFNKYSLSIQTHRDCFAIDMDKETLKRRIQMFRDKKMSDEIIRQSFHLMDSSEWKLSEARKKIMENDDWEQDIVPIIYRPFDRRWIFYNEHLVDRPRKDIMQNMNCENIALLVSKQQAVKGFFHALATTQISESCVVSNKTKEGNYHFPLYLCRPQPKQKSKGSHSHLMMFFEPEVEYYDSKPNLAGILANIFYKSYGKTPEPEEIFHYIYAVLYSNTYRTKYAEFLKIDFPRVPFTRDYALFKTLGEQGKKLADFHLMKTTHTPSAMFQGKGENKVKRVVYEGEKQRVRINNEQYFEGISSEVWNYQIGGYQVLEKWLKDRKDTTLSLEEVQHYCQIVTAIDKTMETQNEIDEIYPQVEEDVIEFGNR